MLQFEPNLTFLFRELAPYDRFDAARAAGFRHAEFLSDFTRDPERLTQAVRDSGVQVVQFNFLDGDLAAGERGFASHPDKRIRWREGFQTALELAAQIRPQQIHSIVGVRLPEMPLDEQIDVLVENLRWAAPRLESAGIPLMVEALNEADNPGYLLQTTESALDVLERVGSPWVRFQFDVYHIQRTQGDVTRRLLACMPQIGHIQIADNPGRHEPGTGEIDFHTVLRAIERSDYQRFVGLEFNPLHDTEAALRWLPAAARGRPCSVDELDL